MGGSRSMKDENKLSTRGKEMIRFCFTGVKSRCHFFREGWGARRFSTGCTRRSLPAGLYNLSLALGF